MEWPFLKGLLGLEVKKAAPGMRTLIKPWLSALPIFIALQPVFGLEGVDFFWAVPHL